MDWDDVIRAVEVGSPVVMMLIAVAMWQNVLVERTTIMLAIFLTMTPVVFILGIRFADRLPKHDDVDRPAP